MLALVSFLSPCMLPVIPAFLAQLAGASLGTAKFQQDLFVSSLLFVTGLSTVFAISSAGERGDRPEPRG